ncbi:hypothetical protein QNA08_04815 [Chelatococcus sp. SYSU_G07232]|uniref:CHAD domain-containing protein n=1 Tax=Chelatococcus albus TaxID=3047466 RepID=A0ABT7ADV7_9HYPH|nr:hypothetical protein [Chelatococcus sp. SYSU_G07232]MDJ1157560.1 hypothetical protein [Chelatococcus sp. SYSU_G07232]
MGLRQKIRRLEGARIEHEREQFRLRGLVRALRREADGMSGRLPLAEQDAARAALAIEHGLVADFGKERLDRAKDIGAAIIRAGREVLAAGRDAADLGTVGGFKAALEHVHSRAFSLVLAGAHRHDVPIDDIDNADPAGTGMRVLNALRRMPAEPDRMRARLAEIERQIPALERQAGAWPDEAELATARARHAAVIAQLRLRQGGPGRRPGQGCRFARASPSRA